MVECDCHGELDHGFEGYVRQAILGCGVKKDMCDYQAELDTD